MASLTLHPYKIVHMQKLRETDCGKISLRLFLWVMKNHFSTPANMQRHVMGRGKYKTTPKDIQINYRTLRFFFEENRLPVTLVNTDRYIDMINHFYLPQLRTKVRVGKCYMVSTTSSTVFITRKSMTLLRGLFPEPLICARLEM